MIVHADDALLVVDKPAGLLAVPGRGPAGQDNVWARLLATCPQALVVHRLDMATSGLMLLARGASVQRTLSIAFARREVEKTYIAVVEGLMDADAGCIDLPLAADWPRRPRQRVDAVDGKPSQTRFQVLARDVDGRSTRLQLQPLTGRTHQLRVHLMAIGHPIRGDALYADAPLGAGRLLLHASALALRHPANGELCRFTSAPPF